MLRKLFVLVAAALPQDAFREALMLCLGCSFLVQHLRYRPFDNRDFQVLDRLEVLNLSSFVITLLGKLFYQAQRDAASEAGKKTIVQTILCSPVLTAIIIVAVVGSHLSFCLCTIEALLKELVARPLRLRRTVGLRLRRWQRAYLFFEKYCGLGNAVTFKDNRLDMSALSEKERRFLDVALQTTLECYRKSSAELRPALVEVALHEAMNICLRTRRLQAEWLLKHEDVSVPVFAAFWGRWRAARLRLVNFVEDRLPAWWYEVDQGDDGDSVRSPRTPRTVLTARSLSLLTMPAMETSAALSRRMRNQKSLFGRGPARGVAVEDLYDALMILWPQILQGAEELHHLPEASNRQDQPGVFDKKQAMRDIMEHLAQQPPTRSAMVKSPAASRAERTPATSDRGDSPTIARSDRPSEGTRSPCSPNRLLSPTRKVVTVTVKASEIPPAAFITSSEATGPQEDHSPDGAVEPLWLRQMLESKDWPEKALEATRRANERSFYLACLLLQERWKTKKRRLHRQDTRFAVLLPGLRSLTTSTSLGRPEVPSDDPVSPSPQSREKKEELPSSSNPTLLQNHSQAPPEAVKPEPQTQKPMSSPSEGPSQQSSERSSDRSQQPKSERFRIRFPVRKAMPKSILPQAALCAPTNFTPVAVGVCSPSSTSSRLWRNALIPLQGNLPPVDQGRRAISLSPRLRRASL